MRDKVKSARESPDLREKRRLNFLRLPVLPFLQNVAMTEMWCFFEKGGFYDEMAEKVF